MSALLGEYVPAIDQPSVDEWSSNIGWGSGSTFQTAASAALRTEGLQEQSTLLRNILSAASQAMRKTHTFDLSEFLGDQGGPGPMGPRGLPGLPGWGTDYVPWVAVPSASGPRKPDHVYIDPNPDDWYPGWDVLYLWSELASAIVMMNREYAVTGWATILNNSASDNTITLWLVYRKYSDGEYLGDGVIPGTVVSEYVTTDIPAGETINVRVKSAFTATGGGGYIYLYGQLGSYDNLLGVKGNHYGISGRGIYPRI